VLTVWKEACQCCWCVAYTASLKHRALSGQPKVSCLQRDLRCGYFGRFWKWNLLILLRFVNALRHYLMTITHSWGRFRHFIAYLFYNNSRCTKYLFIVSRICGDYNRRGIGLTPGFIGSHTVTHNYSVYTSQLSFFSSSEDCCSNSATTAATNSYGVPCHYSLTGAAPLSNTNSLIP
jgi:hypothetical protein